MSLNELLGREVSLSVSDPWDFCSEHGTGPFSAVVDRTSGEELLLRLRERLTYKKTVFVALVATPRHENEPLSAAGKGDRVSANLTPVPEAPEKGVGDAFGQAARWRGWHLVGTISPA